MLQQPQQQQQQHLRQKLHFGICLGPPSSNFQFHLPKCSGQAFGQRVNKLILWDSPKWLSSSSSPSPSCPLAIEAL